MAEEHPYGPQHSFRCPQADWDEARRRSREQGKRDGVSQVLREFVDWYVGKPGAKRPTRPGS